MNPKAKIRVVMAVTNDLVTDRRVIRHARALAEAGMGVTVVGRQLKGSPRPDYPCPTRRMRLLARRGPLFYAEYNVRLLWRLLLTKADVLYANDTDTLPACYVAARMKRCRLVVDAHELFPEVPELVGREGVKRFWEQIEDWLLPRADARFTVCGSIAHHYRERLGVEMQVVRNLPESTRPASGDGAAPLSEEGRRHPVLLYQGCVNKGRGVDWAIDALQWLGECRLVVVGDGDLLEPMRRYAASKPWADRIEFLGRVVPDRLEPLTRQAAVGLVMLEDLGLSYHYALPNRVADFVAAGVPMVVSDLPEMASVVRRYPVGAVMPRPGAQALAEAVRSILERPREHWQFAAAREDMDWQKEKQTLTQTIKRICSTTSC